MCVFVYVQLGAKNKQVNQKNALVSLRLDPSCCDLPCGKRDNYQTFGGQCFGKRDCDKVELHSQDRNKTG